MENNQRVIYDDCKRFLVDNSANLRHLDIQKVEELKEILEDQNIYKTNKLPQANRLKSEIQEAFIPTLNQAREEANTTLEVLISQLQNDENFQKIPSEDRHKVIKPVQDIQAQVKGSLVIDSINAMSKDTNLLTRGLEKIEELLPDKVKTVPRVILKDLLPSSGRLKTEDDVQTYIDQLKYHY